MRSFIPNQPGRTHSVSTPGGGFCIVFEPARKDKKKKSKLVDPKPKRRDQLRPIIDLLCRQYRIRLP